MESLNCNSCGAPLEVPDSANYVKCNHCGQQLVVRRSESATFTEAVDRLAETTEALSEQVEELSRHNELAELDRRWELERENFTFSDKHGHRHLPDEKNSMIGGIVTVVFGCLWTIIAVGMMANAPNFGLFPIVKIVFPIFGVLFVVFGATAAMRNFQMAKDYKAAYRRYQTERERIIREQS